LLSLLLHTCLYKLLSRDVSTRRRWLVWRVQRSASTEQRHVHSAAAAHQRRTSSTTVPNSNATVHWYLHSDSR